MAEIWAILNAIVLLPVLKEFATTISPGTSLFLLEENQAEDEARADL